LNKPTAETVAVFVGKNVVSEQLW